MVTKRFSKTNSTDPRQHVPLRSGCLYWAYVLFVSDGVLLLCCPMSLTYYFLDVKVDWGGAWLRLIVF